MNYMLLIYGNENNYATMSKEATEAEMQAYYAYSEAMQQAGVMVGGEALHPTATATTVQVQNGERITTHGPFAETKEQLGGFYLLKCENLDQALEWAAKCPGAETGAIEVRPVMEF
ncbi:MAG: YciI family protein [Herpetosiphonaceae bacterium]|nr:YciI family protein [Herpetosiphonaceae bacterium]